MLYCIKINVFWFSFMLILKLKHCSCRILSVLITLFTLLLSPPALTHPHSFIEMQTTFNTHDDKLIGLTFSWVMDPMTSMDILYDLQNVKPESERWKKQAAVLMANILAQNYFSEWYIDGKKQNFKRIPQNYVLERKKLHIVFSFDVLLITPISFTEHKFELLTYDPTFYVSMMYMDDSKITLPLEMTAVCEHKLIAPFADEKLKDYAQALDTNEMPDMDLNLGLSFTQRVQVVCQ